MRERLEDSAEYGERISDIGDERELVAWLGEAMRGKLSANRGKLHWRSPRVQSDYLALRLYEEVGELLEAVRSGDREEAWREAADVGNFAAMLADRTRSDGLLPPLAYERDGAEMMGEKLTDRGWVECEKCGGNGEDPDRCDEYCDQGCCPGCVEGLVPPEGMVEAGLRDGIKAAQAASRMPDVMLSEAELRAIHVAIPAALLAAARWEREQ